MLALAVGALGASAPVATGANPTVYNLNYGPSPNTFSQFSTTFGNLSPLNPPSVPNAGGFLNLAMSPDGRSLYAADGSGVRQFNVAANGALSPKNPPVVAAGDANSMAVSPDGRSAYVALQGTGAAGQIAQYNVAANGTLTPKSPATFNIPASPRNLVISPDGRNVYVAHLIDVVSQYTVGANGNLSPKNPATVPGGSAIRLVMSPDGRNVYVANFGAAFGGFGIAQYTVGSGGGLVSKNPAKVPTARSAASIAIHPTGREMYVTDGTTKSVSTR